jgi:hypothetical protein
MQDYDVYDRAVQHWRERGVALLPPASETELVSTFADLGYPLSADVRKLYTTVGGFVDYQWDDLWSFWSLGRIREMNAPEPVPFVIFADYLIVSHLYCFHYESPEVSSVYISHSGGTLEACPVARNVPEFLEKLLRDPDEVEAWTLKA